MAGKIFINYRRIESLQSALLLHTQLQRYFPEKRLFIDRNMAGGIDWLHELERQVAASDAMLALIGKGWADIKDEKGRRRLDDANDFVRFEIAEALRRGIPIMPVLIDGAAPEHLPPNLLLLTRPHAMPFRTESFEDDAKRIAETLRQLIAQRHRRGIPAWAAGAGVALALAGGIAAGPFVLTGDVVLRRAQAEAQRRQAAAEATAKTADEQARTAREALEKAEASRQTIAGRLADMEKERDGFKTSLALAHQERDDARQELAVAAAREEKQAKDLAAAEAKRKTADEQARTARAALEKAEATHRTTVGRLADTEKERDGFKTSLALAHKERDDARQELAAARKEKQATAAAAKKAEEEAAETRRKADDPALSVAPGSGQSFRDRLANRQPCPMCPEMVLVPKGDFTMGSPESEPERYPGETRVSVTIAKPFAVGKYEVTFAEWDVCVEDGDCMHKPGDNGWGRGRQPVINVAWNDAKEYVAWLSAKTGKTYRLLTEAEWEYAAHAGTTTPFWWGSSITPKQANYDGNYTYKGGGSKGEHRQRAVSVNSFAPNPWGLHNVHGNVWEWTEDCWNDSNAGNPSNASAITTGDCSLRVLRGGSWNDSAQNLRSACRFRNQPDYRSSNRGFRIARMLLHP